jgi:ABC-type oligopeptide transport system substrate-binding subunit
MSHEMQAFGLSWIADLPDPDSILASLFASKGAFNFFEYQNAAVDSLLAQGTALRASNDRALLYRRAEKLILQDVAVVPFHHIANCYAVRREVEGLVVTPFGIANLQLETVWLDPAARDSELP